MTIMPGVQIEQGVVPKDNPLYGIAYGVTAEGSQI